MTAIIRIVAFLCLQRCSQPFSPIGWRPLKPSFSYGTTSQRSAADVNEGPVLDVEFERVQPQSLVTDVISKEVIPDSEQTLLDLILEANSEWADVKVPFCDNEQHVVNCKLAITTELDGNTYGVGIPVDHAVFVTIEEPSGNVITVDPDDDDNTELLEIMAGALAKYLGTDLKLKRTPQVLTIEGNLDKYTKNWTSDIFGLPIDMETLTDDSDTSMDSFFDRMKDELGEDEFQRALEEDLDLDDLDPAILALFDVPGLGTVEDMEGIQEMLSRLENDDQQSLEEPVRSISSDLDQDSAALKLVGFRFRDGNVYSLVKPFQPHTIVGKKTDDEDLQFNLLTKDESKLVIPRLQNVCKTALKEAGLELPDK